MGNVAYRFEPYEEVMCVNVKTNEKMFFETLKEASEKQVYAIARYRTE